MVILEVLPPPYTIRISIRNLANLIRSGEVEVLVDPIGVLVLVEIVPSQVNTASTHEASFKTQTGYELVFSRVRYGTLLVEANLGDSVPLLCEHYKFSSWCPVYLA
jgi:hypothetical protein